MAVCECTQEHLCVHMSMFLSAKTTPTYTCAYTLIQATTAESPMLVVTDTCSYVQDTTPTHISSYVSVVVKCTLHLFTLRFFPYGRVTSPGLPLHSSAASNPGDNFLVTVDIRTVLYLCMDCLCRGRFQQ